MLTVSLLPPVRPFAAAARWPAWPRVCRRQVCRALERITAAAAAALADDL